jgi:ABC-type multidrug transport system ATPase subunit
MICDRVVIMDKGRIVREGAIEELTRQTGSVRFDVVPLPDLTRVLAGYPAPLKTDERGFELPLGLGEIDAVIDRLRAAGVSIRAITPLKLTLEESFIEVVRKQAAR